MSKQDIDPQKIEKIIRVTIAVLTAILGFFSGVGTAAACNVWFN